MRATCAAVALVLFAVGCRAGDATAPSSAIGASAVVSYSKASAPKADPNVNYVFADSVNVASPGSVALWSATGIKGDGRLKNGGAAGATPSNEYQGDFCGVGGSLQVSSVGGVFNTDPDINWTSTMQTACGSARLFAFYLGGLAAAPTMNGPHTLIDSLAVMSVGQVSSRLVRFGVHLPNCDGIRFGDYPPANAASITRLADTSTSAGSARRWVVASQGSHRGMCMIAGSKPGSLVPSGVSYYLPFAIAVTEIPQPAPKYP